MKSNIEAYLDSSGMYFLDKIDERLKELHNDFKTKRFGLRFFMNCDFDNCIADLVYMRDVYLKTNLDLYKANKIDLDKNNCVEYMYKKLENVEHMSILKVMQINDPWFGLSKSTIDRMNEKLLKMVKEL